MVVAWTLTNVHNTTMSLLQSSFEPTRFSCATATPNGAGTPTSGISPAATSNQAKHQLRHWFEFDLSRSAVHPSRVLIDELVSSSSLEPSNHAVSIACEMRQQVTDAPAGKQRRTPHIAVGQPIDLLEQSGMRRYTSKDLLGRPCHAKNVAEAVNSSSGDV